MQNKFMAIPATFVATALLVASPVFAQVTHVNPGFSSTQGVQSGAGEGCVVSGQPLNNGFSCDSKEAAQPAAPAAAPATKVAPAAPAAPAAPVARTEAATLKADALFDTGKAVLKDPKAIDNVAKAIKSMKSYTAVEVVGNADYRGSDKLNQKLSERRALAVAKALVKGGVPTAKIRASGVGESQPVVGADGCKGMKGKKLSECLAPDRRVNINLVGGVK